MNQLTPLWSLAHNYKCNPSFKSAKPSHLCLQSMDPYKKLRITRNPDGSLTRFTDFPSIPPSGENPPPDSEDPSLSKDIPLNPTNNTYLRIFVPIAATTTPSKLPIIIYFHGGGFVLYSAATIFFHLSCSQLTVTLPAVVLSVEYRLAPEHRLPAAYEDAMDALLWVRDQARETTEPWLKAHADFSRCFLMGSSSGGNIAYRLGLSALDLDLGNVKISGLILNEPFFGGEERTESELRMENDKIVPLDVADLLWELSLPDGANRDHEYCNPMTEGKGKGLPRCLVMGYVGDPLIDRQRSLARMLEKEGVSVVARLDEEGFHGIEVFDSGKAEILVGNIKRFVYDDTGAATAEGVGGVVGGAHRL